jgi:hypothetical protein
MGLVKEMELPPATLVLTAAQLPGKVKLVEDCTQRIELENQN